MGDDSSTRPRVRIWVVVCAVVAWSAHARAQPWPSAPSPIEETRPWAVGVAAADQAQALELYAAGNREFAEARFAQALANYREAIRHWDHPAIRFNMAVCLINLDQALEAHEHIEKSLAFGERALGPDAFGQALIYLKLLDGQLSRLTIACKQPGMQVTLDGKLLFTGPGTVERTVMPGEHQVVAARAGFLTDSKTLVLVAGKATAYDVRSIELVAAPVIVRRWASWRPWAVLGGGAAAVGGGVLSYRAAGRNYDRYDRGIAARCAERCSPEKLAGFTDLQRYERRGDVEQVVAFSLFAAGGAAVIAGVVGLVLNQPHIQSEVAPAPGGVTVSVGWRF